MEHALTVPVPEAADSSRDLLRRARDGDLAAMEALIRTCERSVLMIALRMLGRLEDAQDAAQEVFLKMHRNLSRFDEVREFGPWIYRITINTCCDMIRRRRPTQEIVEVTANAPDPEAMLDDYQRRRRVAAALQKLPEKERAAVVLRDIEGLETEEVARILGSTPSTVRSQVSRARTRLAQLLGRKS